MNVKGKMILITGGAGGLGSAMAKLLCENGAKVLLMDLEATREKGEALAAELKAAGGEAWFCGADVTSEDDWKKAVDFAAANGGKSGRAGQQRGHQHPQARGGDEHRRVDDDDEGQHRLHLPGLQVRAFR